MLQAAIATEEDLLLYLRTVYMLLQATGKQDASESRSASACKFSRAHFGSRGLTVEGIGLEDVRLAGSADSLEPLWASLRLWHHMIRLDLLGRLVTRCFRSLVIYGTQGIQ